MMYDAWIADQVLMYIYETSAYTILSVQAVVRRFLCVARLQAETR